MPHMQYMQHMQHMHILHRHICMVIAYIAHLFHSMNFLTVQRNPIAVCLLSHSDSDNDPSIHHWTMIWLLVTGMPCQCIHCRLLSLPLWVSPGDKQTCARQCKQMEGLCMIDKVMLAMDTDNGLNQKQVPSKKQLTYWRALKILVFVICSFYMHIVHTNSTHILHI